MMILKPVSSIQNKEYPVKQPHIPVTSLQCECSCSVHAPNLRATNIFHRFVQFTLHGQRHRPAHTTAAHTKAHPGLPASVGLRQPSKEHLRLAGTSNSTSKLSEQNNSSQCLKVKFEMRLWALITSVRGENGYEELDWALCGGKSVKGREKHEKVSQQCWDFFCFVSLQLSDVFIPSDRWTTVIGAGKDPQSYWVYLH